MPIAIGLDTSNYTTSLAYFDGREGRNVGRLLDVPEGALGLRQSDALFQHVKRLPDLTELLWRDGAPTSFHAVGASTRPRAVDGSYMPCFLAGESQGRSLAGFLRLPFFSLSHQQGHIAAAAWSAGQMNLLDKPHLAWHLSGGTTELLYVAPQDHLPMALEIGGSTDISAGQLIDRCGKRLGLAFPAGKAVDALSREANKTLAFPVKVKDRSFSLSGLENKFNALAEQGETSANICRFVLDSLIDAIDKATCQAREHYPDLPILYAGGVASNQLLRMRMLASHNAFFALPDFSTDNAMGTAILAHRLLERTHHG